MLEAFVRDVRYTIRALRANPGIATVAILSLALGIGKCAISSLINAVTLKPLPSSTRARPGDDGQTRVGMV